MAGAAFRLATVMGLLLSAGCSRPPPSTSAGTAWVTYACEDGRALLAAYADGRTAQIRLAGASHTLKQAVSGSGARFTGDGLQWWIKGDTGMLAILAPGEEIAAAPGVRCGPQSEAPVAPPEPEAPGGAQAAATVVETYYALLESGRTSQAARLRIDGLAEDLRPYRTLSAQVGAPGPVEGAAGSLYVDVPVVTYGRLADGTEFHRSGKATLRRVSDVPGATAVQRTWRIDRVELDW